MGKHSKLKGKGSVNADPAPGTGAKKKKRKTRSDAKGIVMRLKREYPGHDPRVDLKPPVKPDIEKALPEPEDEASKHQYPPPKRNPLFRNKWMTFVDSVVRRENFNIAHLDSLEILCDLYVEYESLQEFIRTHGRSYCSIGRQGEMWKFYPEVAQLNRTQSQIKEYTKMLDLKPKRDHGIESGGESDKWE